MRATAPFQSYFRLRAERARREADLATSAASRLSLLRLACLYENNARLEEHAWRTRGAQALAQARSD